MGTDKNVQTVKDFIAAIDRGDREALLALVAEDIEWIIPGKDWPLAGTRHGHAGLADLLETASKSMETSRNPGNSWRKEIGSSSSASRREKSKLRTRRLWTTGSSPSRSGMAD
jgi:ketosteroid isomerase-like protein